MQFQATNSLEERILQAIETVCAKLPREIDHLRNETKTPSHPEQHWRLSLHGPALQSTLARGENVLDNDLATNAQQNFLSILHFDQINNRYDTVAEAHGSTLEWTAHFDSRSDVQWHNFARWVKSNDTDKKIYWVAGRPGSGKSTLMKYLASNTTIKHLF